MFPRLDRGSVFYLMFAVLVIGFSFGDVRVEHAFFKILIFSETERDFVDLITGSNGEVEGDGLNQVGLRIEEKVAGVSEGIA